MSGAVGKLDEISRAIGALEQSTSQMTKLFDRHCEDDSLRHNENLQTLAEVNENVSDLKSEVKALTAAVGQMQPLVAGYAISRWKAAGAMSLAVAILSVLGFLLEKIIEAAVTWLITRGIH